jgi:hypothetical protein
MLCMSTEGRAVEMFTTIARTPPADCQLVGPSFGVVRADAPDHPHHRD